MDQGVQGKLECVEAPALALIRAKAFFVPSLVDRLHVLSVSLQTLTPNCGAIIPIELLSAQKASNKSNSLAGTELLVLLLFMFLLLITAEPLAPEAGPTELMIFLAALCKTGNACAGVKKD